MIKIAWFIALAENLSKLSLVKSTIKIQKSKGLLGKIAGNQLEFFIQRTDLPCAALPPPSTWELKFSVREK